MSLTKVFSGAWSDTFPHGWAATEHLHPHAWEIMIVNQGSVEVDVLGRKRAGTAGSIFILPPRTLHREVTTSREHLKMVGIYVRASAIREQLPEQLHDVSGRVGQALEWIHDLKLACGFELPVFDDLSRAILFECRRKDDHLRDQRLVRVRDFIDQSIREELSISRLAEIAGMSRRHFTREFTLFMRMPPMAYVRKVRLENARRAISRTNLPLRVIAEQTGFRDEYEFSRVFRRAMGFAPSALRKKASDRSDSPRQSDSKI